MVKPVENRRALVAAQRVDAYEPARVAEAITALLEPLGGWAAHVRSGDRVLVKPNFVARSTADRAVCTHPVVITEVCRQLIDFGARPIVGDAPTWGSLRGIVQTLGLADGLARLGVEVVPLNRARRVANQRGTVFERLTVDATALDADAIVNLPKCKAHRQLYLTLAIKNMFGCVPGRRKSWWHVKAGNYESYFGRMLVETWALLRPTVTILDAIVGMEGNGPIKGDPRPMGFLLASPDGPAIERVGCEILGATPARLPTLVAAGELGVGTTDLGRIDLVGATLAELRVRDFRFARPMPIGFSLPRVVKSTVKNAWLIHQERAEVG